MCVFWEDSSNCKIDDNNNEDDDDDDNLAAIIPLRVKMCLMWYETKASLSIVTAKSEMCW